MLPILLDLSIVKVVLVGEGKAFAQRRALLDAAGGEEAGVDIYTSGARPAEAVLQAAQLVFVAGLDETESAGIAQIARLPAHL